MRLGELGFSDNALGNSFHDQYVVGPKLGRGCFAQVNVATRLADKQSQDDTTRHILSNERAVKVIKLEGRDRDNVESAARTEAIIWRTVGLHANCVSFFEVFFGEDLCYMVMERCSKELLSHLESIQTLNERSLSPIFSQMVLGIEHLHFVGVVHRDIKPDNFLVGGIDGQTIKLADFNLSAILPKEEGKLQGPIGTAPFMCPEMLQGGLYDTKADVWSFGVIVYLLLYGTFPYMPKEKSERCMKAAIAEGVPGPRFKPVTHPAESMTHSWRSSEVVLLVRALLERRPDDRPSSHRVATHLVAAVDRCDLLDVELPSLRPTLRVAKKLGAFDTRKLPQATVVDHMMNALQIQTHGKPLPECAGEIEEINK
jgi:serine/threonine protein kinase